MLLRLRTLTSSRLLTALLLLANLTAQRIEDQPGADARDGLLEQIADQDASADSNQTRGQPRHQRARKDVADTKRDSHSAQRIFVDERVQGGAILLSLLLDPLTDLVEVLTDTGGAFVYAVFHHSSSP